MRTDAPLNFRYQDILTSIVRAYIDTGEPVGSRTISKRRHNTLSAASIRNVMADLAEEGYLSQPRAHRKGVPLLREFAGHQPRDRQRIGPHDQRVPRPRYGGRAGGALLLHPGGTDAQRRHRRRDSGTGSGTRSDPTRPALRPARADGAGDERPHGAQPRSDARRAHGARGTDFHLQLREPQLQRLATRPGAPRTAPPHRK